MPDRASDDESPHGGVEALTGLPDHARGPFLPTAEYVAAFRRDYARDEVRLVDKLECGQQFKEPGFASWEAFARGAWRESFDALAAARPQLAGQFTDAERRGLRLRRVRYVELPPSDYVVWETAVLRQRVALGENVRVVTGQGRSGFPAPPPPLVFRACHSRDHLPV